MVRASSMPAHPEGPNAMQHQEQHDQEAARLIAEAYTDDAPALTRYRDTTPPTPIGAAPVPQPGARAPMSQRATDISVMTLSAGVAALPLGGGAALVLWQLSSVDPAILALAAATPVGLAGALGIAARMIGRALRDSAAALSRARSTTTTPARPSCKTPPPTTSAPPEASSPAPETPTAPAEHPFTKAPATPSNSWRRPIGRLDQRRRCVCASSRACSSFRYSKEARTYESSSARGKSPAIETWSSNWTESNPSSCQRARTGS